MFEKSWTDAILSSLLWFFYRHLNGSSEYIRAPNQRSIPLLHFPPKKTRRNNLFHCPLPKLFHCPQMNPSWNSGSGIQRKDFGCFFSKVREVWKKKWRCVRCRGRASGDGSFHPENWWKLPQNAEHSFSALQKFHKGQYLVLLSDQTISKQTLGRYSLYANASLYLIYSN